MWIKNALVYTASHAFEKKDVCVKDGVITAILENAPACDDACFDAEGAYLIPGFINIHVHGAIGLDTMGIDQNGLEELSKF